MLRATERKPAASLVENGIPPSPFIRQLLKRAPIEGEERVEMKQEKIKVLIAQSSSGVSKFGGGILGASWGHSEDILRASSGQIFPRRIKARQ